MEKINESFAELLSRKMNENRLESAGSYGVSVEDELKAQFKETLHSNELEAAHRKILGKLHWF